MTDAKKQLVKKTQNIFRGYRFYDRIQRGQIAYGAEIYFMLWVAERHICFLFVRESWLKVIY